MKSTPTLTLQLRTSRWAAIGATVLYLCAIPMPWLAAMPVWLRVLLSLALLLLLLRLWREYRRTDPQVLRLLPDGAWQLQTARGEAEYSADTGIYCTPWLIVLPLCGEDGQRVRLLLWPDSADRDEQRRLRAWLRWGQTGQGEASASP